MWEPIPGMNIYIETSMLLTEIGNDVTVSNEKRIEFLEQLKKEIEATLREFEARLNWEQEEN